MPNKGIPITKAGHVVAYSPRPRRPWRHWWIVVALPFVAALLVEILR